jgi:hypothetical protein
MAKKKPIQKDKEKPRVHPDLDGFDIDINSFGEVTTNYDLDKINMFLNKHVDDKKLRDRDDIEGREVEAGLDAEDENDNVDEDSLPDWDHLDETDDDLK